MAESPIPVGPHPLDYRAAPLRVRRPLASVLTWQIIAWGVFAAFVLAIATIVAPKFEAIFRSFNTALPTVTVLVLAISRWVRLGGDCAASGRRCAIDSHLCPL